MSTGFVNTHKPKRDNKFYFSLKLHDNVTCSFTKNYFKGSLLLKFFAVAKPSEGKYHFEYGILFLFRGLLHNTSRLEQFWRYYSAIKKENEFSLQITSVAVSGENICKTNYTIAHCSLDSGF